MSHKRLMIVPVVGCALLLASCGSQSPEEDESPASSSAESSAPDAEASTEEFSGEALPREPTSPPPPPPACPYHEEVSEVPDDEQYELAIELGCEYDIYGEIVFEEPIRVDGADETVGLIDPDRAMTEEEMEEAGYL